jgi:hypothetical protein
MKKTRRVIFSGREEVLIVSDSTEKIIVVQVGGTALATANRVGKKGLFFSPSRQ